MVKNNPRKNFYGINFHGINFRGLFMDNIVHVSNIVCRAFLVANLRNSFSLLADLKS